MSAFLIFSTGFLAQIIFAARTFIQWIISERSGRVVSPIIYWQLSLAACILMFCYGLMRQDFPILLGQLATYFIYIRNLQLKNAWEQIPKVIRQALIMGPAVIIGYLLSSPTGFHWLIQNPEISTLVLTLGTFGQLIFTGRFVYQWHQSEIRKSSVLPMGFWILSLSGTILILIYAVIRTDPVLLCGHGVGLFIYARNFYLSLFPTASK